ncbi:MAG: hypothetical protein ACQEUT_15835 [Bacillota bacterium]
MSETAQMIIFIFTILVVAVLYNKSKEEESLLLLKLFGFTFLGAFMLDLGDIKLPLGFTVFLLFFRNIKVNKETKHIAACIGLAVFMLGIFVPQIEKMIFERKHTVEIQHTNFYSGSLADELGQIKDQFKVSEFSTELNGLDMVIDEEGNYRNLSFGLSERTHDGFTMYNIVLSRDKTSFEVTRYKLQEEEYFDDMMFTEAELVLGNFDLMTDSMLDFKGKDFYALSTDGRRVVYEDRESENFQINTAGKFELKDSQLPVHAIVVDVCGSKELNEHRNPVKCEEEGRFLLDVLKVES